MQWTRDLYDFESTPPPGSWERINFELDNNISEVRQQLQNIEEEPPAKVWTAVQKELDGESTIIIPWYKKTSRWVAAASITGVLLLAAYFLNDQENFLPADIATSIVPAESAAVAPKKKIPTEVTIVPPVAKKEDDAPVAEVPANNNEIEEVTVPVYPRVIASTKIRQTRYASVNVDRQPGSVQAPSTIQDDRDYMMMRAVRFNDGNYIQMDSPEGNTTRLSYKLQEMIPALKFNMENTMVDKWKTKLQSTILVPASTNFFDITEMATLLSEKQ